MSQTLSSRSERRIRLKIAKKMAAELSRGLLQAENPSAQTRPAKVSSAPQVFETDGKYDLLPEHTCSAYIHNFQFSNDILARPPRVRIACIHALDCV